MEQLIKFLLGLGVVGGGGCDEGWINAWLWYMNLSHIVFKAFPSLSKIEWNYQHT